MNSMLALQNQPQNQPRFISRVFTDVTGRQFRLTFLVVSTQGELKGRLISAEPIAQTARLAGQVTCEASDAKFRLPISCPANTASTEYVPGYVPVVSPYFSLEFLITSQPTRAPSHV